MLYRRTIRTWILVCATCLSTCLHGEVAIELVPHFDGKRLIPDSLRYPTSDSQTASFERLSLLLSNFAFQEQDTATWIEAPDSPTVFFDLASRRLSARLSGIPEGTYQALRFDIGLPTDINYSDPANYPADHPLNPNLNKLHWTWAEGYIFCALEGRFRDASTPEELNGFVLHLGNDWAKTTISLPAEISVNSDTVNAFALPLDVATLFRFPQPIDLLNDGNTTHSRDETDTLASSLRSNLTAAWGTPTSLTAQPSSSDTIRTPPLYLPENPVGFPITFRRPLSVPNLPLDNPLLKSRVNLGHELFSDPLLSSDGSTSCSSCHIKKAAFADPRARSLGVGNTPGQRHSMPLFNLAWKSEFFWDGRSPSLRDQVLDPITDPAELGNSDIQDLINRLDESSAYPSLFEAAFGDEGITEETISLALENFLLTLTSQDSRFDRAMRGDPKATLTPEEQRGFELFFTEYDPRTGQLGADCFHCHGGALFTDHSFRNNGLSPRSDDQGRFEHTGREADLHRFAVPSLRNIALTAPYMHDSRFATLDDVLDHYSTGIHRSPTLDPNLAKHPAPGIPITPQDKAAIIAFLETLSDPMFMK